MQEFKIRTQHGLILETMMSQPNRWFLGSDFCGGDPDCPFIGYKAPVRISEMKKTGILLSQWSSRTTVLGDKLKEYKVNNQFYKFAHYQDKILVEK
jgi:hypothetical protein